MSYKKLFASKTRYIFSLHKCTNPEHMHIYTRHLLPVIHSHNNKLHFEFLKEGVTTAINLNRSQLLK